MMLSQIRVYAAETAALLNTLTAQLEADPRIVAMWLFGSHGRGEADALSDLDVWLVVDDAAYDEIVARKRAFVDELGDAVFHLEAPQNAPPGGAYLAVQYDAPTAAHHVDFYWQPMAVALRPPATKVCFEKAAIETTDAPLNFSGGAGEGVEQKHPFHQFSFLWMMLMVLAKNVWRNPQGDAIPYLNFALDTLHVLEDEASVARSFGETAVFHSGQDKIVFLLDVAHVVQTLMHRYSARGADVPHSSADGALRFLEMIRLAMLF